MPANSPNPVISTRTPRLFPTWIIQQRQDGTYDAQDTQGVALSPGFNTYEGAYEWLLNELAGA